MKYALLLLLALAPVSFAISINSGDTVNNLSASTNNTLRYELVVPSGASDLDIAISGGSGDADLYVRSGSRPTSTNYNCRPYLFGNNERCTFSNPQATTYYIDLVAYSSFSGLSLSASYQGGSSGGSSELSNNQGISVSGAQGSETLYQIAVPSGARDLSITTAGGSGALDLYVRFGAAPTTTNYDCRPFINGNNETCNFSSPQTGTYYIMLRGYYAYSGATLTASYTPEGNNGGGGNPPGDATWEGFNSYYADAIGKSGQALENALGTLAALNHSRMSYSQVWNALRYTDEDPNNSNNVVLIYTGRSQSKTYTSSGNPDPDAWNREHSWPKSHGFPSSGDWAYTDIHHLRPSDASVNSSRGNKDYDNGGSGIGEAPGNYTDSDSFEPRNEVKGDLARMMFYMDIRYNGGDNTGTDDLQLVNYTGTSGARLGKLCTLLAWHNQDPVSSREITRHARIVERQGNRNPFVDYPAWANQIWDSSCN